MNLSTMLNDGDANEDKNKRASPEAERLARSTTMPLANGQPGPPLYPTQSQSQTPMHAPPPHPSARSSTGPGLTPLQTPGQSQHSMGGQYPFPPSAAPQHSAGPGHPPPPPLYRAPDSYSATTPIGRPPSHGHVWQSPQQPPPVGLPHGMHQHHPNSVSPTPSSHHSQHTPHSVRQSPVAHPAHPPYGHPSSGGHPSQYHHSQPSTPLGPPPLVQQRSVGSHPEVASPYHQRNHSITSNGYPTNSPSIQNLVESPNAHFRPSPSHQRRISEYRPSLDSERERSMSVSPKTQVPRRLQSNGSHGSSSHEFQSSSSNRSSMQQQTAPIITQQQVHHVTHPPQFQQPGPPQPLPNLNAGPTTALPVQQHVAHVQPPRQSPSSHPPPAPSHPSPPPPLAAPPPASHDMAQVKSLKRPAENDNTSHEPPHKRTMRRRHSTRPPWAQLAKNNPYSDSKSQQQPQVNGQQGHQPNGQLRSHNQPNGYGELLKRKAWQENPPLDFDLIRTRSLMGPWEKSFRWVTPHPELLKAVTDWMYVKLSELSDVGNDAREGTIEIEARVGKLNIAGTDDRCNLPVLSSTVIDPRANSQYSFQSSMSAQEHKALNDYLNGCTQDSMASGRVNIKYEHLYETDSFHALSPIGLAALPTSLKNRRNDKHRTPRLRISRNSKTGQVLARIVKIHLDDLHIFNPQYKHDIRISLNLEVNLDRPDIDPTALILPSDTNEPERVKDRLSYKHLAYSIDLTKVSSPSREDSYELEVEVDAAIVREQMRLISSGEDSAFGDVLAGFLDNVTFLVRQRS